MLREAHGLEVDATTSDETDRDVAQRDARRPRRTRSSMRIGGLFTFGQYGLEDPGWIDPPPSRFRAAVQQAEDYFP